jgi:general secretion pathway protein A
MYKAFFGLTKDPFTMSPDPEFLVKTRQHREALAGLTYAILGRRGISVLAGDVGTGKTTLLAKVLQLLSTQSVSTSVILNPTLNPAEFIESVMLGFGIDPVPESKTQRLRSLERFLAEKTEKGQVVTLIVDEAHLLSPAVLEEIRLLGNIEPGYSKLLQIVLLGQNELDELLNRESLRQFKQRIALRFSIGPLSDAEVAEYLEHRWVRAGGNVPTPFSPEATAAVQAWSKGIPRLINALCDNALLLAFGEQSKNVTGKHIDEAASDLHLAPQADQSQKQESTISAATAALTPSGPAAAAQPELAPKAATAVTTCVTPEPAVFAAPISTSFRTLERYEAAADERSILSRCAGWFGLAH